MNRLDRGIENRQRLNELLKELFRKTIHICAAIVPLGLHYFKIPTICALLIVMMGYIVSEILRRSGHDIPLISIITQAAARKRDENKFVLGPVMLCLGIVLCALVWPEIPARVGILALAFGDGLASLGGKFLGRVQIPFTKGKTAAGSLTCFAAIFASCFCITHNAAVALCCGAAGMFIEVLPLNDFDNLLIPVAIGGIANLTLGLF